MKTNFIILSLALATLISCKTDNIKEVLKNSKTPRLDLAYHVVVKSEMEELGNSTRIVDKSIDTTSVMLKDIIPNYSNAKKTFYWKKEIFPKAYYISGDSLESYKKENIEKYWKLRDECQSGWIQLTAPYFTEDQKVVLLEVTFFQGRLFGASSYYLLEWTGKKYEIKEKRLTSIS